MSQVWQIMSSQKEVIQTVEELTKQLLLNRGLKNKKEREEFFNPRLSSYEKELNLPGIGEAKKRILKAIQNKEIVYVYGDYDVDGLCGTAVVYLGLASLGAKVLPYIPHREKEGYGLSKEGLGYIKDQGASLVITVDNGIVALEQAKFAKSLRLDLIITDHHLPLEEKPQVEVVIHSTKMCGAGVAWCLIKQMVSKELALELLDLVALATVGDLTPLVGVNRCLVRKGLEELNKTKRVGLLALIKDAGLELGNLDTYHLGYILGPRLNAKGRLEHALDALRLLCTRDREKAKKLARILSETNDQKKKLVDEAILEAKQVIEKLHMNGVVKKKILVLHSEKWLPGIVGLIAGRISEEYHVPAVAIACGDNESKGSARSIKGVNIIEIIRSCSELLIDVGGHPQAAGFTLETSKLEIFRSKLEEAMEPVNIDEKYVEIEAVVDASKLSKKWVEKIKQFEPFGVANPKPKLAILNGKLRNLKTVGNGQHLKGNIDTIPFIAFGMGKILGEVKEGGIVDMAGYLEIDQFNGSQNLQFKVTDLKF